MPSPNTAPLEMACTVYTVHAMLLGKPLPPRIVEYKVVCDPFTVDLNRPYNVEVPDEIAWFAAIRHRIITFAPPAASAEYGENFGWEEVESEDGLVGAVPTNFSMSARGSMWFRTFAEAKSALFLNMIRMAETEINNLRDQLGRPVKECRAQDVGDVERAS